MAGVSLTWYSALEAGKGIRISEDLLERLASALRLDLDEREHLFELAAPRRKTAPIAAEDPTLQAIIDGFTIGPAFVSDRFWTVSAYNALGDAVYGFSQAAEKNLLVRMLLEPELRALHEDWERIARQMVAILHLSFGHTPDDPRAVALVARLRASSAEFDAWWNEYRLGRFQPTRAILHHPTLGRLTLTFASFVEYAKSLTDDHAVIVFQPPADDETMKRLQSALDHA